MACETLPFYRSIGEVILEIHLMSDEKVKVFFPYTIQRCFLHELLIVSIQAEDHAKLSMRVPVNASRPNQ